jgi:acyl-CoA synthetase (AMP-forming)/AMP-acid ligase II
MGGGPTLLRGRGYARDFQAMNLGLPLDCVATEPSTICDAIRVHAALDPERPAIVCTDLPALTFGELDSTIRQIGDELKAAGISAASRVGIVLPNGPEAAVVAIAVCAHAVCFPLSAALSEPEFEFELTRARLDWHGSTSWRWAPRRHVPCRFSAFLKRPAP